MKRNPQDNVRALHLKCDVRDYAIVKPVLEEMYSLLKDGKYPLEIKMCLILEINTVTNFSTRSKIKKLWNRKARFDKYWLG